VNISLSWSTVAGATKYRVYKIVVTNSSTTVSILNETAGTTASDSINGYAKNTIIAYYVVAINTCGQEGPASNYYSEVR
jgi:hypothetical protein